MKRKGNINGMLAIILVSLIPFLSGYKSDDTSFSVYVMIFLAVVVILFLIGRELLCWYFKINERVSQQAKIIELLDRLISATKTEESPKVEGSTGKFCSNCGSKLAAEDSFCTSCGEKS